MTQPESRTVEEIFAETIWDALSDRGVLRIHADSPKELADITASILAAAKEHGLVIGEGELDAAWKEVLSVLPKRWLGPALTPYYPAGWEAEAHHQDAVPGSGKRGTGAVWGDTPAAALHALAERLRR